MYRRFFKPLTDRLIAGTALVLLSPVITALALLVRYRLGRPVLFRQTRIGLLEQPFEFVKFRTMTDTRDERGVLLADERRLTPFGAFLRSSSLDELPQLWNVLRGEMSLIGPRPLLPQYLPRYSAFQRRRHEAKPGITGLAQVNGRNSLSWEDKFRFDVEYVDHCSPAIDTRILLATLASVVRRKNINQEGEATAAEFMGSAGFAASEREWPH